jgi:hypothetical protein
MDYHLRRSYVSLEKSVLYEMMAFYLHFNFNFKKNVIVQLNESLSKISIKPQHIIPNLQFYRICPYDTKKWIV